MFKGNNQLTEKVLCYMQEPSMNHLLQREKLNMKITAMLTEFKRYIYVIERFRMVCSTSFCFFLQIYVQFTYICMSDTLTEIMRFIYVVKMMGCFFFYVTVAFLQTQVQFYLFLFLICEKFCSIYKVINLHFMKTWSCVKFELKILFCFYEQNNGKQRPQYIAP